MINSSSTINIDGVQLEGQQFDSLFTFDKDDSFSRWVVRPVAILTAIGIGAAILLASAFMAVLSFTMIPLLAISFWAVKTKVKRDLSMNSAVVDTQKSTSEEPATDAQKVV